MPNKLVRFKSLGQATGQQGFSLLEVLIAVVILSVGLLGLAGMQVTSLKYVTSSLQRTQATSLAYDMLDRIRANPDATNIEYTTALGTPASTYVSDCLSATCTTTEMATFDLFEWKTAIEALLPGGTGSVDFPAPPAGSTARAVTITLEWIDKRDLKNPLESKLLNVRMSTEL